MVDYKDDDGGLETSFDEDVYVDDYYITDGDWDEYMADDQDYETDRFDWED